MLHITKASAGSGKTYSLALEYIKLVLGHTTTDEITGEQKHFLYKKGKIRNAHNSILAITFTNKATEEMKARIVDELYKLATHPCVVSDDDKSYMPVLNDFFGAKYEDIKERANDALNELLSNYTDFNVSTIDSFFQNILRTFAYEIDILDRYGLELRDEAVIAVAVQDIIHTISGDKKDERLDWIEKYINKNIEKGEAWNMFRSGESDRKIGSDKKITIRSTASFISKELYKENRTAFENYFKDPLRIRHFRNAIESELTRIQFKVTQECTSIDENILGNNAKKFLAKCHNLKSQKLKDIQETASSFYDKRGYIKASAKNAVSSTIFDKAEKLISKYIDLSSILDQIYMLGFIGAISENIEAFRRENSLILLSDTNDLLKKIITDEDVPWVYERVGTVLRHYLIDEFQDTSKMQWSNLRPLLSESLSHDRFNLVIGDEKQSIYRFRNADPSLLRESIFNDFNRKIPESDKEINNSTNWRSAPAIVQFNNTFFTLLREEYKRDSNCPHKLIEATYENVVQQISPKNISKEGYVEIMSLSKADIETEEDTDKALNYMKSVIDDAFNRGYSPKDIAILVDSGKQGENAVRFLSELNDKRYSPISEESLYLRNNASIAIIVNAMRLINLASQIAMEPQREDGKPSNNQKRLEDGFALSNLIKHYNHELNSGNNPSDSLTKALAEYKTDSEINISEGKDLLDLYALVETIIKNYIDKESLKNDASFICGFQDIVADFAERYSQSLDSFLKYWDNNPKLSLSSASGADAISVMTIHKSKGLEFPVVIIPYAKWNIDKCDSQIWVKTDMKKLIPDIDDSLVPPLIPINRNKVYSGSSFQDVINDDLEKAMVDNINKTYVAFTRAVRELYIITPEKKDSGNTVYNAIESILNHKDKELQTIVENTEIRINGKSLDIGDKCSLFISLDSANNVEDKNIGYKTSWGTKPLIEEEKSRKKKADAEKETQQANTVAESKSEQMPDYLPMSYSPETIPELDFENEKDLTDEQKEGNKYHKILSYMRTADDLPVAIKRAKAHRVVTKQEFETILCTMSEWFAQTEVQSWFEKSNRVLNERKICDNNHHYYPDRVVQSANGSVIVIDFKFGEKQSKYVNQVKGYMNILAKCGAKNITGKIWYPKTGEIVTVNL